MTRPMSTAHLVNTLSSQSNDPNSVSHACSAQLKPSNIDENTSTRSIAIEIDSSGKGSCRDDEAGALILLEAAETEYPKNHYRAASQDSQSTDILQGGFRRSSEEHRHITNAVDPRGKEDSASHMQQYARQPKKIRSTYEELDMSSKTESQASQRLSETGSGVSIPSHDVEKQMTRKEKKAQLDSPSSSSTRSIPAKADVLRNIDSYHGLAQIGVSPATCGQNLAQMTQPELTTQTVSEDPHAYPSTFGEFIRIAGCNGERPLKADGSSQRLDLLKTITQRLARDHGVKYIWKKKIQWHQNLLPTLIHFPEDQPSTNKYLYLTYGQLLEALEPSKKQEYLRLVIKTQSYILITTSEVSTHVVSAL